MEQGPAPLPPKANNRTLYIVIGVIVLCFLCCGLALLAQSLLENSDFSLVNLLHTT
jgi:hypothetical protein